MIEDYEYFGKYDEENSKSEMNLEDQIREWLGTMELMFDYINSNKPDILNKFLNIVEAKYSKEIGNASFELSDLGFDKIDNDQTLLSSHPRFKNLSLQIIMKYLPLRDDYILSEKLEPIKWVDHCRAKYTLLYHRITALVEILGRDAGIEFFKEYVHFRGKELAKKHKRNFAIEQARENFVKSWKESNGFEFGVVDFDKAKFLAKFDRCVSHESMKHVEDQELAYYAVCYSGPIISEYLNENVSMRRSVTLFTGDFCDELYWDRKVHDQPEQPSHEFSRKIVRK
jgi:hypothetical protein